MRKVLGISIIVLGVISVFVINRTPNSPDASQAQSVESQGSDTPRPVVSENEIIVTPELQASQVTLIANYTKPKTGSELQVENNCTYLVNAGFYTKEQRPVGYFKGKNLTFESEKQSLLFDGFITINQMETPRITRALSEGSRVALQTGPILIENGQIVPLSIKNDQKERRAFALITGKNTLLFGIVPQATLTELPKLIFEWAQAHTVTAADAINLDGGSASTFRGPTIVLPEISPIGSAFCATSE